MNKIKFINKHETSQVVIKSLKGQQVSENEVFVINTKKIEGLLPFEFIQKGSTFKLVYNITGLITLREYLATPLNKMRFAKIIKDILTILNDMERLYLNQQYLLLDVNQVLVNPATQQIYLLYVPIQFFDSGFTLREFLLSIIQFSSFDSDEDTDYVKEYINILNSGINFSLFALEQYLLGIDLKSEKNINEIKCQQCGKLINESKNYCPSCGAKVSGKTSDSVSKTYNPLEERTSDNQKVSEHSETEKYGTQGLSDGVTTIENDYGGTMLLGSDDLYESTKVYLIRKGTQEKILIEKFPFIIGKGTKYCDYVVNDNNTVSRKHVEIYEWNHSYYIKDLGSTNKTYVNNRMILPEKETEIMSNTVIRLSNEEFIFLIN